MTTPLCRICTNSLADHSLQELDTCVAKAKGWTSIRPLGIKPLKQKYYALVGIDPKRKDIHPVPVPHYSKDMDIAIELWDNSYQNRWVIEKTFYGDGKIRYNIWNYKHYLGDKQIASAISSSSELSVAICYAYLTEKGR